VKKNTTAIAYSSSEKKFKLLELALYESNFWQELQSVKSGNKNKSKKKFSIFIKVDFEFYQPKQCTATDPELVEHLIDLLYAKGFSNITIGDSCDGSDLWLENRNALILADLLEYNYTTKNGNDYEIVDLSDDLVDFDFPAGALLHGTQLSTTISKADFIILFSKNKTDQCNFFSLGLHNFLRILPLRNKSYHYHQHADIQEIACELTHTVKIDFCLIDAFNSNHSRLGSYANTPIMTRTLIAGKDILQTDSVAAIKMGLKLEDSVLYKKMITTNPSFEIGHVKGPLDQYENWQNTDIIISEASKFRKIAFHLENMIEPSIFQVDTELFPFKEPLQQQINKVVSAFYGRANNSSSGYNLVLMVNCLIGMLADGYNLFNLQANKKSLWQQRVALNINAENHKLKEYRDVGPYLDSLSNELGKSTEINETGLSWSFYQGQSVLFQYVRHLPINFDAFVSQVDVSKSIQYMNDYIGGLIVPIKVNHAGKNTYQIERNLYLPQPNYLALSGGKNIDVTKLEYIKYSKNEHKIIWKTVFSENESAEFDDGWVCFRRSENNHVEINVFGRQLFTLPPFWQLSGIDHYPFVKSFLVEDAYTHFFKTTMANFEAVAEGREVKIGKPVVTNIDEPGQNCSGAIPSQDDLVTIIDNIGEYLDLDNLSKIDWKTLFSSEDINPPDYIDEQGFSHFSNFETSSSSTWPKFKLKQLLTNKSIQLLDAFIDDIKLALEKDFKVL